MVVSDGDAADAVDIWRAVTSGAGAGDLLLACVRRFMSADGWSAPGAFAIAVAESAATRVLVRGIEDVTVLTAGGDRVAVGVDGLLTWVEVVVADAVEVRVGAADGVSLPVPGGVVRAGALRWAVPAHPAVAADAADDAEPVTAGSSVPQDVAVPAEPTPIAVLAPHGADDPPPGIASLDAGENDPVPAAPRPVVAAQRSLEETRVDLDPDAQDFVSAPPAVLPTPVAAAVESAAPVAPTPPPPPVDLAAPTAPPDSGAGPAPGHHEPVPVASVPEFGSGAADFDGDPGDHDGMTQLAEDLPVGYTPPPLPAAPPPGTVLAAICPAGHPNAPHSRSCRLCGQLIVAGEPVPVPRPVLARIRLSTGEIIDVDRAIVIGRSPYVSRVAAVDLPRLVAVPSPNQDISRAHAEIRPEDWHLVVADLDSTNGTTVRAPGRTPQRLRPGQEVVVEPGWTVELGDGVGFVVEAV